MKLSTPITLKEAADFLKCEFVGSPDHLIEGINEIHMVEEGDAVFVDHPKYYDKALKSRATTIIIDKEVDCPEGKGLLVSKKPFFDFNKLTLKFKPFEGWEVNDTVIGENCMIHPSVSIGKRVKIGDNVIIHPGVVLYDDTIIGNNVIIHGNSVIGGDAFYYKKDENGYNKMHTCGRTILEDNVEIGPLSSIDRGVSGDTVIGNGSKLDDHVHIGHDTVVGKNCLFAAHVGVSGCVIIKDNVTLWGQVGVVSGVTIEEGAEVFGQSGVGRNLKASKKYLGSPCDEARVKFKEIAAVKKLPEILDNL